ncbi:MAG: sigma-70 family RNA polymerase sigma factor [Pyrinomonadaceae bacterium]|nr:sigma-70 family RNA polymerase sigma factor [Pyrinomonadaceae bacterium]
MNAEGVGRQSDELLLPFLRATRGAESDRLLSQLLTEHAAPIIKAIVANKLGARAANTPSRESQDAEDVYSETLTRLLSHLSDCKNNPNGNAIGDFRSYVAVTTYNACHAYLRQKYPQRWRQKNRLRYLLTHRKEFALWEIGAHLWLGGFAAWRGQKIGAGGREKLQSLCDDSQTLVSTGHLVGSVQQASLVDLLTAIFGWLRGPAELDELVGTVADLQGVKDQLPITDADEDHSQETPSRLPDSRVSLATEVEQHLFLRHLWSEICELPVRQRVALLLNLRDAHGSVIALLPLTGIASIRQIADVLAIAGDEFARMWNELPMDDAAIAAHLGVTRQQVINLRKSARARLGRRVNKQ